MDPTSDSTLHFHHHRRTQRHQPFASSQPSGSMPAPSNSHSQPPAASPSPSTAASSNPFVRSHHGDLSESVADFQSTASAQHLRHRTEHQSIDSTASHSSLNDDHIAVAIKCPSLDKDSAILRVKSTDTVLALKNMIESTWPGAPRADGMRCIRSGRILGDSELLGQLAQMVSVKPNTKSKPSPTQTQSRLSLRDCC